MTASQRCWSLLVLVGLFAGSGASCPHPPWQAADVYPRVLPPAPTLEQVINVVNRNNSQIQSFSANRASISGPNLPAMKANLAFQRPGRLRLRADLGVMGAQLDLGSNDQLFWFWIHRSQPPGVYYCRHDQFAASQARQVVPIEPRWLIESLGIAEIDPGLPCQGPVFLPNDRLRIDAIRETPDGPVTKVTILDGSHGWILEQYLVDARRRLLASSTAGQYRRDPMTGLFMPAVVQVNCPQAQFSMRIDLGEVEINRLSGDPAALWSMPSYPGAPAIDMADPSFRPPMLAPPPPAARAGMARP
jgi:hypothetical protein